MEVDADYAYFYDIAEMTPTSEMTPQPGQDTSQPRQDIPQVGKSDGKDVKNKDQKSVPVVKDQKINSAVKTGDYANPLLWVIILLLAVTSAGTTVLVKTEDNAKIIELYSAYIINNRWI